MSKLVLRTYTCKPAEWLVASGEYWKQIAISRSTKREYTGSSFPLLLHGYACNGNESN